MSATVFDGAWDPSPADRLLVEAKRWGSRLRFAIMLLFYRARGRFPRDAAEMDNDAVADLARRLGVPAPGARKTMLPVSDDRTLKRQRAEIRALLGFREATVADAEGLGAWLQAHVATPRRRRPATLMDAPALSLAISWHLCGISCLGHCGIVKIKVQFRSFPGGCEKNRLVFCRAGGGHAQETAKNPQRRASHMKKTQQA